MARNSKIKRVTKETQIEIELEIDGSGTSSIETGIPFFDHMLDQLSRHGSFDLTLQAKGDLEIDGHHTVEDVGIAIGQAFKEALGEKAGIARYGSAIVPMDESLIAVAVDLSGRPYFVFDVDLPYEMIGNFDTALIKEFLTALVNNAGINLHVKKLAGDNPHHIIEGAFKGLALALDMATKIDPRKVGQVPSTKGIL